MRLRCLGSDTPVLSEGDMLFDGAYPPALAPLC